MMFYSLRGRPIRRVLETTSSLAVTNKAHWCVARLSWASAVIHFTRRADGRNCWWQWHFTSHRWKSQILVESRDFCLPTCTRPPPIWAGFPSVRVYCHEVWYGKTRMEWLPDSAQNLKIWLLVLTEYMKVTDRRTDRQADRRIDRHHHDGIGRAYAWHWPDHHWQRNWRVPWTSSRMCADKKRTLRATILTIFSQRLSFCEMWQDFLDFFFGNHHKFELLTFAR